jgi:hypothetical protein
VHEADAVSPIPRQAQDPIGKLLAREMRPGISNLVVEVASKSA